MTVNEINNKTSKVQIREAIHHIAYSHHKQAWTKILLLHYWYLFIIILHLEQKLKAALQRMCLPWSSTSKIPSISQILITIQHHSSPSALLET